jgi:hypothetical protein
MTSLIKLPDHPVKTATAKIDFSAHDTDAKNLKLPSYAQIRPHLVQPAKDAIKVINGLSPAISAFRK